MPRYREHKKFEGRQFPLIIRDSDTFASVEGLLAPRPGQGHLSVLSITRMIY
jgi:hypothetical protein